MEDKYILPMWRWILLGVLVVGFVGVLVNYLFFSRNGTTIFSLPGMNRESTRIEQEFIPEPTPEPGT